MANISQPTDCLEDVPDNISLSYLPNYDSISERSSDRGLSYYVEGYIHNINVQTDETSAVVRVSAKCWRSMKKSESPHQLSIDINIKREILTESLCSCKAG